MPVRINININDEVMVTVRLTDYGRALVRNHYRGFHAEVLSKYLTPGPVAFQIQDLMRIFGPVLGPWRQPVPFVNNEIVLMDAPEPAVDPCRDIAVAVHEIDREVG